MVVNSSKGEYCVCAFWQPTCVCVCVLAFVCLCLRACVCVLVFAFARFSTSAVDCAPAAADCAVTVRLTVNGPCRPPNQTAPMDSERCRRRRRWLLGGFDRRGDPVGSPVVASPQTQAHRSLVDVRSTVHTHTLTFHTHVSYLRSHANKQTNKQTCTYLLIKTVGLGYNCYKLRTKCRYPLQRYTYLLIDLLLT